MIRLIIFFSLFLMPASQAADMIIIKGADGGEEFSKPLKEAVEKWQAVAVKAKTSSILVSGIQSRLTLEDSLEKTAKESESALWIIYVGHGTYLNSQAKLNLEGKDISAEEMNNLLAPFKREIIFINCASASAPFISALSAKGRIVITATKNSQQMFYTKFNEFMAEAISNEEADIDKDSQTSLFESFLYASGKVKKYYDKDKRISGENAVIDDNGDKLGSLADMFDGLKAKKANERIDGFRAHQIHLVPSEEESNMPLAVRVKRNTLERELNQLKLKKETMDETSYYEKLELILKKLALLDKEDS